MLQYNRAQITSGKLPELASSTRRTTYLLWPDGLNEATLQLRKDSEGQHSVNGLLESCYQTLNGIGSNLPAETSLE